MMISCEIVDLADPSSRSDLLVDCLRLRQEVFISQLGWNLYERLGCEFDQYDTPASLHIAALKGRELVGCMRIMPTNSDQSGITYMILDAHRGKIPNLPAEILNEEVVSPHVWEASRLAISSTVDPKDRNSILIKLVEFGREYILSQGGCSMLGLMNPVFERVFRRAGMAVRRFGEVADQRDGRVCVLRWDFEREAACC